MQSLREWGSRLPLTLDVLSPPLIEPLQAEPEQKQQSEIRGKHDFFSRVLNVDCFKSVGKNIQE